MAFKDGNKLPGMKCPFFTEFLFEDTRANLSVFLVFDIF